MARGLLHFSLLLLYYANTEPGRARFMTSSQPPSEEQDFEQALAEVERSLEQLKARYFQVKADQQRQDALQQEFNQLQQQYQRSRTPALRSEIKQIKQRLDDLDMSLESQLFSWSGLKEVFWMAVRFGGLGLVLGWFLHAWAG